MYQPDTLDGVVAFCNSEGQPCDSVKRAHDAMVEAIRCLTLIGHVPRSDNTWADRCQAATAVLQDALRNPQVKLS